MGNLIYTSVFVFRLPDVAKEYQLSIDFWLLHLPVFQVLSFELHFGFNNRDLIFIILPWVYIYGRIHRRRIIIL